jgi:hypothetical protein
VRRAAAGAALLFALTGPAQAQSTGTVQYSWVEVTVSQFTEEMYFDWTIGAASLRSYAGVTGTSFLLPASTPVGTVATVIMRTIVQLETQCHVEVILSAAQGCEARVVSGRCAITSSGMSDGRCRVAVGKSP